MECSGRKTNPFIWEERCDTLTNIKNGKTNSKKDTEQILNSLDITAAKLREILRAVTIIDLSLF